MQLKLKVIILISLLYLGFGLMYKNSWVKTLIFLAILGSIYYLDIKYKVNFKIQHYLIITTMSFLGVLLNSVYYQIPFYDKILHFSMPILGATVIYYFVDRLKVSFVWKLIITLSFILSASAILEIIEYVFDYFLNLKLQGVFIYDIYSKNFTITQNGLADTMEDLIYALLGGITYMMIKTIFYNKAPKRNGFKLH